MIQSSIAKFFINRVLGKFNHLRDVHRFAFKKYAERVALICADGSYTYAEIASRSLRLLSYITAKGIRQGDYAFVLLPDGHEQYEVRITTIESGMVHTAFSPANSIAQIQEAAEQMRPKIFIYQHNLGAEVATLLQQKLPGILLLKIGKNGSYEQAISAHQAATSADELLPQKSLSEHYSKEKLDINSTVFLSFTSGTTGKSKALISSSRSQLQSLKMLINNLRIHVGQKNIMMTGIPLIGAGSGVVLPTLLAGGTLVIPDAYEIDCLLPLIEKYEVTRCFLTPSLLIDLLDSPNLKTTCLKSLTTIIYGTAPLSAAKLKEGIEKLGPIFQQGYGMAEVLPPVSLLQPHEHINRQNLPQEDRILSSVGKVVKGVDVRIVNDEEQPCQLNEIGEVTIFSPTIFDGYWQQPELSGKVIRNGYMFTSDYGFLDDQGYLHILDRKADIFEHKGKIIYPRLIEEIVHTHEAIKEAVVIKVDDKFILCASLRHRFRSHVKSQISNQLYHLLNLKVASYQIPDQIVLVEELPRSFLGKILRTEIRQWISSGALAVNEDMQHATANFGT